MKTRLWKTIASLLLVTAAAEVVAQPDNTQEYSTANLQNSTIPTWTLGANIQFKNGKARMPSTSTFLPSASLRIRKVIQGELDNIPPQEIIVWVSYEGKHLGNNWGGLVLSLHPSETGFSLSGAFGLTDVGGAIKDVRLKGNALEIDTQLHAKDDARANPTQTRSFRFSMATDGKLIPQDAQQIDCQDLLCSLKGQVGYLLK
jgi:hypothetical protein